MKDLPWISIIAKIGVPSLIVMYLLNMIPGMPSPINRFYQDHGKQTRAINRLIEIQRITCEGVWRGNADMIRQCQFYLKNEEGSP